MSLRRVVLRRIALGFVAAWALLSAIFVAFRVTDDWYLDTMLAQASRGGTEQSRVVAIREQYLNARGFDGSLFDQYVDWLERVATLQWGESFESGRAALPLVVDGAVTTGSYLLPALVLGTTLALGLGLYTAMRRGTRRERGVRSLVYLGLGVPNFWLGAILLTVAGLGIPFGWGFEATRDTVSMPFLHQHLLPIALVTTTIVAGVVSYARAYSLQYVGSSVTKLVRAKGGGERAVARHVLRNAAIPLVSLVFTELFALLALSVFVIEILFGLEGLGLLFYNAVWTRDLPILLGVSLVFVGVGVALNVVQDVAYSLLDPRVDTASR